MIRVEALWLCALPLDMRAGIHTLLARVIDVFGAAHPHHAYLFANQRGTRMKVLVCDGFGIWLAQRQLQQGRFAWPTASDSGLPARVELTREQFDALILGLPWQQLQGGGVIRVV